MQTAGYNGACIVVLVCWFDSKGFIQHTPASGVNVGTGKFGKKNKRNSIYTLYLYYLNRLYGVRNKAVAPGKKSKK